MVRPFQLHTVCNIIGLREAREPNSSVEGICGGGLSVQHNFVKELRRMPKNVPDQGAT
jgi:hypothetical protein